MNKVLKSGMALAMLVTAMPASALAVNSPSAPTQTTPVNATIKATPINVTVSDHIKFDVLTNTNDATVTALDLTNNSTAGVIKINKMAVTAAPGWTKVENSTNFKELPMNAKKFSLVHDGKDLHTDQTLTYEVNPKAKKSMAFTGKTGAVTTAVGSVERVEKVADVILTIAYK